MRVAGNCRKFKKEFFYLAFLVIFLIASSAMGEGAAYFSDKMEGGTANWTADPPWGLTNTTFHSTTNAWTDSKGTYYANNVNVSLTLATSLDLTAATNPQLVFWHKYQIESDFDFGYLEISTDGGTTWLSSPLATYTGISDWRREQTDLSSYAGQASVKVRFRLVTDKTIVWDGWTIDDVSLAEPPHSVATLTVNNPTATTLTLTWDANLDADFTSYKIYRSLAAGVTTNGTLVTTITDKNTLTYTDTGLNPNTSYYYKVYVFNTDDLAAGSKEESNKTAIAQFPFPFLDGMEGSASGWTATGSWALTQSDKHSGSSCWTDSPAGAYGAASDSSLQITVDLGQAIMPVLSFWHRYTFDTNSDFGYVEVREVGTTAWVRIYFATGTQASWLEERVDISSYAGKKLDIRFRVVTDSNGIQSDGWYLDDVKIDETTSPPLAYPFKDDMESVTTPNNWHSSSWALVSDPHSGNYSFTDSPAGNYGDLVQSWLVMANTIDLKTAVHPQLSFWHKYEIYSNDSFVACNQWTSEYDYGYVYLSTYNGQPGTWKQLAAFKGSQPTWKKEQIDLSTWAGLPNVRIMFQMVDYKTGNNCSSYKSGGWTIDDVALEEVPFDVTLTMTSSSMNSVVLSWTQNNDTDFDHYEIYRSSTAGVTRSGTLVASITTQTTTSSTDPVALIQPGTYYYRMWVKDKDGTVSLGSNEVVATYTVPTNSFPFSDNGEGGTDNWSFGSGWGLTDASVHEGTYAWTDSVGTNYPANANSSMSAFINLSGTTTPVLSFWHKYSLEYGKDFIKLEVSTDNGQTWTELRSFTGTETLWNQERVNLSPYAGNAKLGLRFRLISDGANQQDGWYMDNFTIAQETVQAGYPLNDTMENGPLPWFYTSTWGLKELSPSESHTGQASIVWSDSPEGAYGSGSDSSLQITIDLGSAIMPVLTFWHRYYLDTNSDFGYVEVREVGNATWSRRFFVTGSFPSWIQSKVDLSGYAGKKIDLRFRLVSDANGTQSDGWLLDDISIAETKSLPLTYPFRDTMDTADTITNWNSSSWGLVNDPHSGNYAFTDSPAGNYGESVDSWLILANTIDLKNAVHPELSFWHKYDIYSNDSFVACNQWTSEYDYGYVYISTFNGQPGTWKQLASFKGSQAGWKKEQIDLSAWAGLPNVRILFDMMDNKTGNGCSSNRAGGWTLDDVAVEEAPIDVAVSITSSSLNTVVLAWTPNSDTDFDHYEIYRSSTAGVTRSNTLVASISTQATSTYTDQVAIVQPGTYYYRIWVKDKEGNVSLGSNEAIATYTVPTNLFPFTDDGEGGTDKWSFGTPWGLTDATKYEGTYTWTDSPGANYPASANSCLTNFINLSGTTTPVLTFWHKYSLEENKDFIKLEISTNNGQTWTELRSVTGTETIWNQERINLTPYAGNAKLGFRFCLVSDGTNQQDGWFMDQLAIAQGVIQATYPLYDNMENGVGAWFYSSPWGLIDLSAADSHTGEASTVWSDSPEGAYGAGTDTALQITIDLGSANMPVLAFWHRYAFDTNSDYGYVEVREVGTSNWLRRFFVTGTSASWVQSKVDLSGYAGKKIDLRFRVVSDTNGTQSDGWLIDDISIDESKSLPIPYPFSDTMDTEATATNWNTSSWNLVDAGTVPTPGPGGIKAFTDSPAGNYGEMVDNWLILANSIDLRGSAHPQLTFWHKREFYSNSTFVACNQWTSEYDYGYVYISTFNGHPGTWKQLAYFGGIQSIWNKETIDLSAWVGLPNVRILFDMIDNKTANGCYSNRSGGWTIDDVRIGEDENIPSNIRISSGDGQVGLTETALSYPFNATVLGSDSKPKAGVTINFEVKQGGGNLSAASGISDVNGQASTVLTLGANSGINSVSATIAGTTQYVTFTATGYLAGQAMTLTKVSGDYQVNVVTQPLANPLTVKVTDVLGNPVVGANVTFSKISGDGTLSKTDPVATSNEGFASNTLTLGATTGSVTISATAAGLIGSPLTFTAYTVLVGGTLGDTDGDGMPDDWETRYGLNPLDASDAALDKDGDGLTNLEEYIRGINPTLVDTDNDGMPDGWEVRYGLNPLDPRDAAKDSNNNGKTNLQEYQAGTIPVFQKHFTVAYLTTESMDFWGAVSIDGFPAEPGDEVAAICPGNIVCGQFTVITPGEYGLMHVYADDSQTTTIEGAKVGDPLIFRIWDASAKVERVATVTVLTGTNPPSWTSDGATAHVNINAAGRQIIPLRMGWNLMSFSVLNAYYVDAMPEEPMLPGIQYQQVSSIADALISIDGLYEVVRSFDSTGAHTFDPALPAFSDLKYLAAGYGYWIKMKQDADLELSGVRALSSEALELHPGWNLVGYWGNNIRHVGAVPMVEFPPDATNYTLLNSLGDSFNSIKGSYEVIRSFDVMGSHTFDPALPGNFNDLKYVGPGYGMWIKMKALDSLSYE